MTMTPFQATAGANPAATHRWDARVRRRLLLPLVRTLFPLTIAGRRNLLALPTPCIFAADHGSHLDTLAILAALPEGVLMQIRVAAAEDYWYRDSLHRFAMSAIGGFPFPRQGGLGLTRAATLIAEGNCILIYPEGTRAVGPFRPGVALLATQTGLPIIPIAVHGGRALWPKGRTLPRRGPLTVSFGVPLRIAPGTAPLEATRQIERAVRTLAANHATSPARAA